jgi:hypothetical protein
VGIQTLQEWRLVLPHLLKSKQGSGWDQRKHGMNCVLANL